ncbi:MAG: hypothetical protein JST68_18790 [Bacteroidetes bacterium]|nr:hypothetical protein [Bacteroidota bacterium]
MSADTITRAITERVKDAKSGTLFFPGDLLELGSPEAIHTTFSRLAESKQLMRLAKGIYLKPKIDPELGPIKPSLEELARTIAEREKVVIRPTGSYALNRLGLSTQVPTRVVFLTSGNPKNIKVGRSTLVFQKTTPKQLAVEQENIFLAIQALITLKDQAENPGVLRRLTEVLAQQQPADIRGGAKLAPQRVARILYQIAENIEKNSHG